MHVCSCISLSLSLLVGKTRKPAIYQHTHRLRRRKNKVMASFLSLFSMFVIVILFAETVDSYCDSNVNFQIQFPFWLPGYLVSERGYPGFELSCNNRSQMIFINLPNSGNFTVEYIDYVSQSIYINDPRKCLPEHFLRRRFNLSDSPFRANQLRRYSFYNCSSSSKKGGIGGSPHYLREIQCLSGANYTVIAVPTLDYEIVNTASCAEISQSIVPVRYRMDLGEGVKLNWDTPSCISCLQRGGYCGFKGPTTSLEVKCYGGVRNNQQGLTKVTKYEITIGVGISGLLCLIGLACYTCGSCDNRRPGRDWPMTISSPQPAVVTMGLDGPVIESYPKFVLGQSGRHPKPNDGCCAICLSEYRPSETLRSIPDCNHYFHAECVDGWLNINPTCPLCRNTPDGLFQTRLGPPMVPSRP